jgi:hypothetical protein
MSTIYSPDVVWELPFIVKMRATCNHSSSLEGICKKKKQNEKHVVNRSKENVIVKNDVLIDFGYKLVVWYEIYLVLYN